MADIKRIMETLGSEFAYAKTELKYDNIFQLLVAVILSAQCTDKRVNMVTEELFKKYKTPADFVSLSQQTLEGLIHSCGFYRNKAKNLIACAKIIEEEFDGIVPSTRERLMTLPGVGRKVANVIMAEGFNKNAIAVDTHVFRVSRRLGLSSAKTPEQCEQDLMKLFPEELWSQMHIRMLLFGRYKCRAIKPDCEGCSFCDICMKTVKK
ncbi:MAG: endonuclease III [Christensenellaceae bacterium]|jgi:endonuclease-3|nr:endonuclease III [Christensenellaceae bacterium]